jgi:hypothetical protein
VARLFLAANKADNEGAMARHVAYLAAALPGWVVMTAADAWAIHSTGNYDSWPEIVCGRQPDGQPLFDAFVVPNLLVGRVTAEVVRMALSCGRPVLHIPYWPAPPDMRKVVGVQPTGTGRWDKHSLLLEGSYHDAPY